MNNELYEKNIRIIEKRWPEYLEGIRNPDNVNGISCEVIEEEGRLIPRVMRDGKTYSLSSAYSDEVIVDRWAEFVNLNVYEAVIFLFGLGTGIYVKKLLEKADEAGEENVSILVFEPDAVIIGELFRHFDLSGVLSDERVTLDIGSLNEDLLRNWTKSHVSYNNIRNAGSAYYINYPRIYPEIRKQYDHDVEYLLTDYYGNTGFKRSMSKTVYSNTLDNIRKMADSLSIESLVSAVPKDMPVFLVSSGPSLSGNIQELKRAKGKGLIIAVDSALGVFDKAGLIPDIYVTIDPEKQEENFSFDWIPEVPAVVGMSSPEFVIKEGQPYYMLCPYDNYTGRFIVDHSKGAPYHVLISGGGSVATWAFSLARAMGAKTLVFVGQDLAYTGDKAHAAGVAVDDDAMLYTVDDTDIYGEPIRSSRQLISYRKWFEHAIAECEDLEAFDATEGGAYIKGTKVITLKEVIDRYCTKDRDLAEMFSRSEPLFDEEERKEYYELLGDVPEKMGEIIRNARKLISNYDKMEKAIRSGNFTGDRLRKLMASGKKLSDEIEENPAFTYIDMLNSDSEINIEENINNKDSDSEKDFINMCELGREHTGNILRSAEKVKKDFSENIDLK